MADVIKKNRQNKYLKKCKLVTAPRSQGQPAGCVWLIIVVYGCIKLLWVNEARHQVVPCVDPCGGQMGSASKEIQDPKSQVMLAGNSNVRSWVGVELEHDGWKLMLTHASYC